MQKNLEQLAESPAGKNHSRPELSREKFEELLAEHRGRITLFLLSIVQNVSDAEDLCQKASVIMWRKFSEYDPTRSFLAWASGIARLEAMNHRRARAADRHVFQSDVLDLLTESLETIDQEPKSERLAALKQCIRALPPREQSFLERIYWEGASFESVAEELGCSLRTFYNRMYLLRRRLLQCVTRRLSTETHRRQSTL